MAKKRPLRASEGGPGRLTVPRDSTAELMFLGDALNKHLWRACQRTLDRHPGPVVHKLALLLAINTRPLLPGEVDECEALALAMKERDDELGSLLLRRVRERTTGAT